MAAVPIITTGAKRSLSRTLWASGVPFEPLVGELKNEGCLATVNLLLTYTKGNARENLGRVIILRGIGWLIPDFAQSFRKDERVP